MIPLIVGAITLAAIYSLAATGLGLIAGRGGMLSLAHAACVGAGAYSAAVVVKAGGGIGLSFLVAGTAGGVAAGLIALTAGRLQDDAFAIITFAIQVLFVSLLLEATSITRGALGITGIRAPKVGRLEMQEPLALLVVTILLAILGVFLIDAIASNRFGRILAVVRDDEVFAASLGIRPMLTRSVALLIGGGTAGVSGALYAFHVGVLTPAQFGIMESVLILAMVLIGGAELRWGPMIGAFLLVLLPEGLRFLGVPNTVAAEVRTILYGFGLVIVVYLRSWGSGRKL